MANITYQYRISDIFYNFCGQIPLWDEADIFQNVPNFSTCLIDTVLAWIPCMFIWIAAPFFLLYLHKCERRTKIFESKLGHAKWIVSSLLICSLVIQLIFRKLYGYACYMEMPLSQVALTAFGVKSITLVLTILLQQIQRRKGIHSSGVPFVFWIVLTSCELPSLYNHILEDNVYCGEAIAYWIYFSLLLVQLVLHCFAETSTGIKKGYHDLDDKVTCPEENASTLSTTTFHWLTPLIWTCFRNRFSDAQFWDQTSRLKSYLVSQYLENGWKDELDKNQAIYRDVRKDSDNDLSMVANSKTCPGRHNAKDTVEEVTGTYMSDKQITKGDPVIPTASLYKTMFKCFWLMWIEANLYRVISVVSWLVQPILVRTLIYVSQNKSTNTAVPDWIGYTCAVFLFVTFCVNTTFYHIGFNHMHVLSLRVKAALLILLYKKVLTVNKNVSNSVTIGETVNLMSVDCQRIQDGFVFSVYLTGPTLGLGLSLWQLWAVMGVASLGGLLVVLILAYLCWNISYKQYAIQKRLLTLKGERIKMLTEVLSGMKVLKMYAWEMAIMEKIGHIRNKEIACLKTYGYYAATVFVLAVFSPFLIYVVVVGIQVLISPNTAFGPEEAYTAQSIVNIMRITIMLFPPLINGAIQAFVSIGRIQEFLRTPDITEETHNTVSEPDFTGATPHALCVDNGTFTWNRDSNAFTLERINLEARTGDLIAVVGAVGSGKSSLVSACLGEMERLGGRITIQGTIAYVPQEAWTQSITVRDNILFGTDFDYRRYNKVIAACALIPDMKLFPAGDLAVIGDKGINISGGQKQRVNLARAVYNNADIYFLDDTLSAVDSHVGKHLFNQVIGHNGLLKNKTRILVTHCVHWLPDVDRIIVLNDGVISESGTYDELIRRKGSFSSVLQEYRHVDDKLDDVEEVKCMSGALRTVLSDSGLTTDDDSGVDRRRHPSGGKILSDFKPVPVKLNCQKETVDQLEQTDETQQQSQFTTVTAYQFMEAMGTPAAVTVILLMITYMCLRIGTDYWLTYWTTDELLMNTSLAHTPEFRNRTFYYFSVYLLYGVLQGLALACSLFLAMIRMVQASERIHNNMLRNILQSPMSMFYTTPTGRMINRFSSDLDIIDNRLPESYRLWSVMVIQTVSVIVVTVIVTPVILLPLIPLALVFGIFTKIAMPSPRQLRHWESVKRSPLYNFFSETAMGTSVIRAFKFTERFVDEFQNKIDDSVKYTFAANSADGYIGLRLDIIGGIYTLMAVICIVQLDDISPSMAGFTITYAVQIMGILSLTVYSVSEMNMNAVSIRRAMEYTKLPSEKSRENAISKPPMNWPITGQLEFKNFTARYTDNSDPVLRDLTFTVNGGEKIGVVGRTGAGKSSLTLCLFRLLDSSSGAIYIDGIDIATLGLHDLRSKLTILPQDPVLFSGTLRNNIDPFGKYSDVEVWNALRTAHLKDYVETVDQGLDLECGENGQNLSMGQRQLVCLTRALLHKTRILVLDEATAAVDIETDDRIQDTIRTQFSDCTIFTIAHRLNTVLDYDRIMVLDGGQITEFESPDKLLANPNSTFYAMAKDARLV